MTREEVIQYARDNVDYWEDASWKTGGEPCFEGYRDYGVIHDVEMAIYVVNGAELVSIDEVWVDGSYSGLIEELGLNDGT